MGTAEIGARDRGVREVGRAEILAGEDRVGEVVAEKSDSREVVSLVVGGRVKLGRGQAGGWVGIGIVIEERGVYLSAGQVRAGQDGPSQIGPGQVGLAEVGVG